MDIKKQVVDLYEVMKSEKLEELEIKERDFHIHLKRKGRHAPVAAAVPQQAVLPAVPADPADDAREQTAAPAGETVQSPIMGMFYRAPSPTAPAFVKEGDIVDAGKTLCIVEAMKVMNEIKAGFRVKIVKILVENGKSIAASQDLFVIERA